MNRSIFKRAINDVKTKPLSPRKISTEALSTEKSGILSRIKVKKGINDRIKKINRDEEQPRRSPPRIQIRTKYERDAEVKPKNIRKVIVRDKDGLITNRLDTQSFPEPEKNGNSENERSWRHDRYDGPKESKYTVLIKGLPVNYNKQKQVTDLIPSDVDISGAKVPKKFYGELKII